MWSRKGMKRFLSDGAINYCSLGPPLEFEHITPTYSVNSLPITSVAHLKYIFPEQKISPTSSSRRCLISVPAT